VAGLARAAGDFATLVALLPRAPDAALGDPGALRQQLLGLLDQFARAASGDGATPSDIDESRFALVAWADEMILRSRWWAREEWQRSSLQMQLFQTANAGKEFFERLGRLGPASRAREVYFLALALGFEGQYAGSLAERAALMDSEYARLRASGASLELGSEPALTPSAYQLEIDRGRARRRTGVLRRLAWLFAIGVAAYALLYALLRALAPSLELAGGG
jgi:type VI secretion system protein ImpK